ncbi:MAG: ATP-binding protein, partial [Cyanobacteria bacterium J06558_2]
MSADTPEKQPDGGKDQENQPVKQLSNLNQLAKALQSFVEQLAQLIVTKNWVSLLLLLDAAVLFSLNPVVLTKFLSTFNIELPAEYPILFWLTVGTVFLTALALAIKTIARKPVTLPDFTERKAIKGLQAFSKEDAVIFAQLQRDRDLRECLEAITRETFRFGILMGESGVGKTSFLQAGLVPQLNKAESKLKGVYIRFTNQEPLATIYQALEAEFSTPELSINQQDLLKILSWAVDAAGQPLILIFDQFEQFFVHYNQKIDRKPFIDALTSWYCGSAFLPVKIIISIRGDLADKLIELQKALGYSLSPYEVFRLERFSPEEATKILQVIAEAEAIKFDEKFVRELTESELASKEDCLISPVDLQVLARTIERQKTEELQAFNRSAFQKIGGIEGLMTRFLNTTLNASIPSQREAAIQVLLAMTDLERNVRAGVLTLEDLQQKIQGTLTPGEIVEAT